MSPAAVDSTARVGLLSEVAHASARYFRESGCSVTCMRDVERAVEVQRPRAEFIEFWFGRLKGLGKADAVAEIIANGANVPVEGVTDLTAALQYGNHTNIQPYSTEIAKKIVDDIVSAGHLSFPVASWVPFPVFVFPQWAWLSNQPKFASFMT